MSIAFNDRNLVLVQHADSSDSRENSPFPIDLPFITMIVTEVGLFGYSVLLVEGRRL